MNGRPAWEPTLSELERDLLKSMFTLAVLALVLHHVPAVRRYLHAALNP